jgi:hypothetical protein
MAGTYSVFTWSLIHYKIYANLSVPDFQFFLFGGERMRLSWFEDNSGKNNLNCDSAVPAPEIYHTQTHTNKPKRDLILSQDKDLKLLYRDE